MIDKLSWMASKWLRDIFVNYRYKGLISGSVSICNMIWVKGGIWNNACIYSWLIHTQTGRSRWISKVTISPICNMVWIFCRLGLWHFNPILSVERYRLCFITKTSVRCAWRDIISGESILALEQPISTASILRRYRVSCCFTHTTKKHVGTLGLLGLLSLSHTGYTPTYSHSGYTWIQCA